MATTPPLYGLAFGKKIAVQTPVIQPSKPTSKAPVNTTVPTISGVAQVGQILTSTNGAWLNNPLSYTYQWYGGNNSPISGATGSTYLIGPADIGTQIFIAVTAINANGSSQPEQSASTGAVIDIIPTINTPPVIPGFMPQVNSPITAIDAIWNNSVTSLAYQWKVGGINATGAGATTLAYTPIFADVGFRLTITVTAINTGGTSLPSTSAQSGIVAPTGTFNSTPYIILVDA